MKTTDDAAGPVLLPRRVMIAMSDSASDKARITTGQHNTALNQTARQLLISREALQTIAAHDGPDGLIAQQALDRMTGRA